MGVIEIVFLIVAALVALCVAASAVNIVPPTQRALVERLGRYNRYAEDGLLLTIPFVEVVRRVDITEQMVDAKEQEVITKDSLNAMVDAQVYFKVRSDEESVKRSQYNVADYYRQIVQLARTSLRAIMGDMNLDDANSQRHTLNKKLEEVLEKETESWGIAVVRTELKEIQPPADVQATMNKVVMAQKEKTAASDLAHAAEITADGRRRAAIKEAEGEKRAAILEAEGESEAIIKVAEARAKEIRLVNEAASKYFKGAAVELKRLETTEVSLKRNTKFVVPDGSSLVNVIGGAAGVLPIDNPSPIDAIKASLSDKISERLEDVDMKTAVKAMRKLTDEGDADG